LSASSGVFESSTDDLDIRWAVSRGDFVVGREFEISWPELCSECPLIWFISALPSFPPFAWPCPASGLGGRSPPPLESRASSKVSYGVQSAVGQ